jgi:hypothetical protein
MEKVKKTTKKATKTPTIKSGKGVGEFAVIETGGKQYRVSVGDSIKIEKIKSTTKNLKRVIY